MKKLLLPIMALTICLSLVAAESAAPTAAAAPSQGQIEQMLASSLNMKDVSYCIGVDIGQNFLTMKKEADVSMDLDALIEGLKTAFAGKDSKFTPEEIQKVMLPFQMVMQAKQKEMQAKQTSENAISGEANKTKGDAFLKANAKKEGFKTTKSGLQYKITKAAKGDSPAATDKVKVHYTGTLIDGTKFDSSVDRGQPAIFGLNQVIPGWTEGIQLMKVGEKATLVIPADLAYGETGAGAKIGPNETLIFEVELLGIEK